MDSYNDKIKFQCKLLSKIYDLMDKMLFFKKDYNPRYNLAQLIPNSNISILDVCFGTGNTSIAIAKKNNKNRITGIDISKDMLRVGERKLKKLNLNNISTYNIDATKMNFKEKFDIVTTSLSLHEMPSDMMTSVVSEMSRLLKDDGRLYIIEWNKPKSFLSSVPFMIFPYLFEPKGFGDFLTLDWGAYLSRHGLKVESIIKLGYTKLITATHIKECKQI